MKNFDIEKLERKNVYKAPENFFEKVQERVILETKIVQQEPAKVIPLKWIYSAAASVVILFSALFLIDKDNDSAEPNLVQNEINEVQNQMVKNDITENPKKSEQVYSAIAYNTEEKKENKPIKTETSFVKTTNNNPQTIQKKAITTPKPMKTEEKMDIILESFSADDIATLATNSEDDIYLELYN